MCDVVTHCEVQHMRKTKVQQQYILMVHNLGRKTRTSDKHVYGLNLKNSLTSMSMKTHRTPTCHYFGDHAYMHTVSKTWSGLKIQL